MRNPFGWDLPPGCTHRQIEEAMGQDEPCAVCGHDPADCICPECHICHEAGNMDCYTPVVDGGHGLVSTREQDIGRQKMKIYMLKQQVQDEEMVLAHLESGKELE